MTEVVPSDLRAALSHGADALRAARRDALAALDAGTTEWEYAGRRWHWPGGESLTYFWSLCEREAAVVDALATRHGLRRIGVGTGRVVLELPPSVGAEPLVAKVARYGPSAEMGDGRPQNRLERELSARFDDHPFLPVLDAGPDGDWVVMPRVEIVEGRPDADEALASVSESLRPYRDAVHFDELKAENVGVRDGRYWLVDYGRPADPTPPAGDD